MATFPVPAYKDGRPPGISSSFRSSDRPTHVGADVMYRRIPSDGGPPGANKPPLYSRRWYMPFGVPVFAYQGGVVTTASEPSKGHYVVIEHPGGWRSQYMHLERKDVKVGQKVAEGQIIGTVGNDRSSFPLNHLHFQLRYNGALVNPEKYLQVAALKAWPGIMGVDPKLFIGGAAAIVGSYWLIRKYS